MDKYWIINKDIDTYIVSFLPDYNKNILRLVNTKWKEAIKHKKLYPINTIKKMLKYDNHKILKIYMNWNLLYLEDFYIFDTIEYGAVKCFKFLHKHIGAIDESFENYIYEIIGWDILKYDHWKPFMNYLRPYFIRNGKTRLKTLCEIVSYNRCLKHKSDVYAWLFKNVITEYSFGCITYDMNQMLMDYIFEEYDIKDWLLLLIDYTTVPVIFFKQLIYFAKNSEYGMKILDEIIKITGEKEPQTEHQEYIIRSNDRSKKVPMYYFKHKKIKK